MITQRSSSFRRMGWIWVATLILGPPCAVAQTPPGWGTDVRPATPGPAAPAPPVLKGSQSEGAGTTNVVRPGPDSRTAGQVTLVAHVTDEGPPLDQGVTWRLYRDKPGPDGKMRLVSQHRDAAPQLRLDTGDYWINAAYGRANLTRRITVAAGKATTERFVINAGALKVAATLASGEPAPDNQVAFTVLSDERDQYGNRIVVLSGGRPGVMIRLNAGVYQIQSTYGDVNAVVRGDVTIEAGKLTEATLTHTGAKATLKLVTQPGGDALADTVWTIIGSQGETVKETAGALPTHVLAPGVYGIIARRQGLTWRRDIQLQPGETVLVEVVAAAP